MTSLQVTVVKCENLAPKDSDGLSDPYVVLTLAKQKHKTPVIKKTLNPTWDLPYIFKLDASKGDDELVVEVWDQDAITSDFEGQLIIKIADLLAIPIHSYEGVTYNLQTRKALLGKTEEVKGTITLAFQVFGTPLGEWVEVNSPDGKYYWHQQQNLTLWEAPTAPAVDEAKYEPPVSTNAQHADPDAVAQLYIHVIEARGIRPADDNGFSDPLCEIWCGDEKQPKKAFSTKTITKTLKPKWNQAFKINIYDPYTEIVELRVMDEDLLSKEFEGTKVFHVSFFQSSYNKDTSTQWYKLSGKDATGEIRAVFEYNDLRKGAITGPSDVQHTSHLSFDPEKGMVGDLPASWVPILSAAGIKKSELKNPETAQMVLDLITNFHQTTQPQKAESPPQQPAALPPPLPPPPPEAGGDGQPLPPPLPPRSKPPLPPRPAGGNPPPPPPPSVPGGIPPPLQLSTPDVGFAPPPPPSMVGAPAGTAAPPPPPKAAAPAAGGSITDQIKARSTGLRPVAKSELPDLSGLNSQQENSLAATLHRAINARRAQLKEDETHTAPDDNDDEWK